MRSIERTVGCSINTVDKLLRDAGEVALAYHDEHVRGVKAKRIQCDEIWSFVHAKAEERADEQAGGRSDDRRLLDLDRDRRRQQVAGQLSGRRSGCRICADADGRSSRPAGEPGPTDHGRAPGVSASGRGSLRRGYRLRDAGEALRRAETAPGSRAPLQPVRVRRRAQGQDHRQPRSEARQHVLHRAGEPHDADEHAAVHSADECLLARSSKTTPTWSRSMRSGTTSSASTRRCGSRPRWRQGSKPGCGRWRMWFGWSSGARILDQEHCWWAKNN